jgi:tRNA dimethylallyltransferase
MTNPKEKLSLALIAGPTASGKTALALRLAKFRDCTIINADSAQVYNALPILSAQPTKEEIAQAPHRLFGYRDGSVACSAAAWADDAKAAILEAHGAERLPILVGGTGLYLQTLLHGIAPVPDIQVDVRSKVRALATPDAYAALLLEDRQMAGVLHANDDSRIKRALEVIRSTGRSISEWRLERRGGIGDLYTLKPVLLLPQREWLHERCDRRFVNMMENGAIQEVENLLLRELPLDAPVMRAIGVPEISDLLRGKTTQNEAIESGQAATRQYAKRQYTWFRNQSPQDWPRIECEINDSNITKFETIFQ